MQYRSVTVLAPAKLNLSLDVVGTLPNGYHDLDMIMQMVDVYDDVIIEKKAGEEIVVRIIWHIWQPKCFLMNLELSQELK